MSPHKSKNQPRRNSRSQCRSLHIAQVTPGLTLGEASKQTYKLTQSQENQGMQPNKVLGDQMNRYESTFTKDLGTTLGTNK